MVLALQIIVVLALIGLWAVLSAVRAFPESAFPSQAQVVASAWDDLRSGHLFTDLVASLFRVALGFSAAVLLSTPLGLWLGLRPALRTATLPTVNFFRSLSPLAWIPFAILWFGIGDRPAIFLIFMSTFFPLLLSTVAAVANTPSVYFRVAQEYGFTEFRLLTRVALPAILPQVITAIRLACGLAWLVVVAAEMIAGRDGLGFSIWDARNGLRVDIVAYRMIVIGVVGLGLDWFLVQFTKLPGLRWAYDA